MPEQITFVVNGKHLQLARRDVESRMRGLNPEPIRRHAVEVGGIMYPVKQVFEIATGLDRLDFTSSVARRNLRRLGFVPQRFDG